MYTKEHELRLLETLSSKTPEDFLYELNGLAVGEEFSGFSDGIQEEWRKLRIGIKNGLMNEEQARFALTAYFKRQSSAFLQDQTSET